MPWATGGSGGGSSSGGNNGPKVGIVVGNIYVPEPVDLIIRQRLEAAGYDVEYVDDDLVPPEGYFQVLVLSTSMSSSDSGNFYNIGTPILTMEASGWDDMLLVDGINSPDTNEITPLVLGHPILAGLPTTPFDVFVDESEMDVANEDTLTLLSVITLASNGAFPGFAMLFIQPSGSLMYDGVTLCEDTIVAYGVGVTESFTNLNNYGQQIFLQAVQWLIDQDI